jgi:hypothetical protein
MPIDERGPKACRGEWMDDCRKSTIGLWDPVHKAGKNKMSLAIISLFALFVVVASRGFLPVNLGVLSIALAGPVGAVLGRRATSDVTDRHSHQGDRLGCGETCQP